MKTTKIFDSNQIIKLLFLRWKMIVLSVFLFSAVGIFLSLIAPFEYTSSTTLLPKTSNSSTSSINSLANITGFNLLGGIGSEDNIPAQLFPEIAKSIPFKIGVSNSIVNTNDGDLSLRNYFFTEYLEIIYQNDYEYYKKMEDSYTLSSYEESLHDLLSDLILINVDERKGLVSISATTKSPELSAQLVKIASQNLQKIIIEFQTKKSKDELDFLNERKKEIFEQREAKKRVLISYEDQNLNLVTNKSMRVLEDLKNEFNLIDEVFKQISQELESQKIKVKKQTPVFSTIQPISTPNERSKPVRSRIVRIWFAFGLIFGVLMVLLIELIQKKFKYG